ncbi:MAG: Ig-like domain-containing protein, partial [Lachnoclostridium sp.]|nr:Ig-like domain-containing protein [Lachnoclostridium sp.]
MRSIMKKAACFALAGALVLTGTGFNTTSADAAAKPKKIVMKKKSITVSVGGKYTLKVKKVSPSKASKAVTYKSKNKKIAKVTKKGVVKGVKEGKTKITVTAKKNKKVKTTVKVKVTPAVDVKTSAAPSIAPSVAPSAAPNKSATPTQAVKPTDQPQQTEAAATGTPKPTRSPRPKATPSPEPTAPPMGAPAAPYKLTLSDDTVIDQTGGSHVINADGSATISVTQQYGGVGFVVPADLKDNNFDTVTVTYKDATNVGGGYGCGLWRSGDDKDSEDVIDWGGIFADAAEGEYKASIADRSETNSYYVNKILLFNNDAEVLSAETPASVTITSVVFSNSKYDGPVPTEAPSVEPSEAPTVEPSEAPAAAPYKLTLSDDTVTEDKNGSASHVINGD